MGKSYNGQYAGLHRIGLLAQDRTVPAAGKNDLNGVPPTEMQGSEAGSGAATWVLSMVCLDEVVIEPGKRACPPLATPVAGPIVRGTDAHPRLRPG